MASDVRTTTDVLVRSFLDYSRCRLKSTIFRMCSNRSDSDIPADQPPIQVCALKVMASALG